MATITDEAQTFISENLARAGYQQTGEVELLRQQVWAGIWRVPTGNGWLYFKVTAPSTPYEPALTAVLVDHFPEYLPPLLGVDLAHGWLLLADGGTPLKEAYKAGEDIAPLEKAAVTLAHLQRQIAENGAVEALLAAGCPDRRLDKLPELYAQIINQSDTLMPDQKGGISQAELAQFRAFEPTLVVICEKLAGYNIPASLHHDDFNAGNVLRQGDQYRFIDWAESFITHPFFSMFVFLRVAKYIFECDADQLAHLRDAYLQVWAAYDTPERLLKAFTLAQRLAKLCRALTWHQLLVGLAVADRADNQDAVPYYLKLCLYDVEDLEDD